MGRDNRNSQEGRTTEENVLWKGYPSQVVNLSTFINCVILNLIIFAVFFVVWMKEEFVLFNNIPLEIRNTINKIPYSDTELLYACIGLMFIPTFYAFWKWLVLKFTYYKITNTRIHRRKGLLSVRRDHMELYRVKDVTVFQPFFLRLFSVGNIILDTSDRSTPELALYAIPNVNELYEKIRNSVETLRDRKRVSEVDIDLE